MRKQTKIAALVSAAALLTIGASMTSFAAGWTKDEAGDWVYKDNDGYNVTDEWRKWTDGSWCYLGEDGKVVGDALVEYGDYLYYVNAYGTRVTGDWYYEENTDGESLGDTVPAGFWYYFDGTTGRAVSGQKKISGQEYRFDNDTHRMIAGWYDTGSEMFFYNDTVDETNSAYGQALTGWQYMPQRGVETDDVDQDPVWYYFKSRGKMAVGDDYIDRKWWHFGEYGATDAGKLLTGWQVVTATKSVASAGSYAYFDEDHGKLRSGWIYRSADGIKKAGTDSYWFYVDSYGVPMTAATLGGTATATDGTTSTVAAIRVSGKTYLVDEFGRMLDGVLELKNVPINRGQAIEDIQEGKVKVEYIPDGLYCFNSDDNATGGKKGDMVLNTKKVVTDSYDNETEYYFSKNGMAYKDTIVGNCYYNAEGHKVVAEYDAYAVVKVDNATQFDNTDKRIAAGKEIIVRDNGTVARNTTVSRVDGYKRYYVGKVPSDSDKAKYNFVYVNGYSAATTNADVANAYEATCYRVED